MGRFIPSRPLVETLNYEIRKFSGRSSRGQAKGHEHLYRFAAFSTSWRPTPRVERDPLPSLTICDPIAAGDRRSLFGRASAGLRGHKFFCIRAKNKETVYEVAYNRPARNNVVCVRQSTTARGYGSAHQALRKKVAALVASR
jgi:hypothetical protein